MCVCVVCVCVVCVCVCVVCVCVVCVCVWCVAKTFRDGSSQRGLAMINVANGPNVAMGLVTSKHLSKEADSLFLSACS